MKRMTPCWHAKPWPEFILLLLTFLVLFISDAMSQQPLDSDSDGLLDADENTIAQSQLPRIWASSGERFAPGMLSGDVFTNACATAVAHAPGFIGYDVVDLGFSDLVAVNYTVFLDYNRRQIQWHTEQHCFDNEGFTVLCRKVGNDPSQWPPISVQTISHHKTDWEVADKFLPFEISKLTNTGILMAIGSHGMYAHSCVCERQFGSDEDCARLPLTDDFIINPACALGPYSADPCPANCLSWQCLSGHMDNPNCWGRRMGLLQYKALSYGICVPCDAQLLYQQRKQHPPWIPVEIALPSSIAFVDLFESTNFTARPEHMTSQEDANFGPRLHQLGMPLRLVNWPHWAYWQQYYDWTYQTQDLDEQENFGLRRQIFEHKYWTEDRPTDAWGFEDKVSSVKVHGPPGTTIALLDCDRPPNFQPWYVRQQFVLTIPDGEWQLAVSDVNDYFDADTSIDYVAWGLGPLADAGCDTSISDCSYFVLDGTRPAKHGLDHDTLLNGFRRPEGFSLLDSYTYEWYDESNGNVLIGRGPRVVNPALSAPATHRIRLDVRGPYIPNPVYPTSTSTRTASDWVTVVVVRGQVVALPDRLDYGAIAPGGFRDRTFSVVNNTGLLDSLVINPSVESNDFVIVAGGGVQALGQGDAATVRVRYMPSSTGSHQAQVSVGNPYCGTVTVVGSCATPFIGQSVYCDGQSGSIVCANSIDMGITSAITVEAVVLPTLSAEKNVLNSPYGVIMSQEDSTVSAGSWSLRVLADGRVSFIVHQVLMDAEVTSTTPVSEGSYTHIAAVFDDRGLWQPALLSLYMNGVLSGQKEQYWAVYRPGNYSVVLGGYSYSSGGTRYRRMYNGILDECRIWNTARTQAQVQSTMQGALGPEYYGNAGSGLVGYWPLDRVEDLGIGEDGADDVRDMTAGNHHGDIGGMIWQLNEVITDVAQPLAGRGKELMKQNYPNPFNPLTTIEYELPEASRVRLAIYRVSGELVCTLMDEYQGSGVHVVAWDGRDSLERGVSSGVYFYVLEAGAYREAKRLMLIR